MKNLKVAVIGSRRLTAENIGEYIPKETAEIISGGAVGIDACAKRYADVNNIKYTEFPPQYNKYGRGAPIIRNRQIVDAADIIIAFWDGKSRGTKSTVDYARKVGKTVEVHIISEGL